MFVKWLILSFLTITIVEAADLIAGKVTRKSKKIYDQTKRKKGSIWIRLEEIEVHAPLSSVISAIKVIDQAHCKDGLAHIESGGIGQRKVVILLESPALLKGFNFRVKVYASKNRKRYRKIKHKSHKKSKKKDSKYREETYESDESQLSEED